MDLPRATRWILVIFLAFALCLVAGISLFLSIKAAQYASQSFENSWPVVLLSPVLISISCCIPYALFYEMSHLVTSLKTRADPESGVELEEQGRQRSDHENKWPRAFPSNSPSKMTYNTLYSWVNGLPSVEPSLIWDIDQSSSENSESIYTESGTTLVEDRAGSLDRV